MPDFVVLSCWLAAIFAGSAIGFYQLASMEIQINDLLEYKIIRTVSSGLLTGYLQGKLQGYLYHLIKEARSSVQAGLLQ